MKIAIVDLKLTPSDKRSLAAMSLEADVRINELLMLSIRTKGTLAPTGV